MARKTVTQPDLFAGVERGKLGSRRAANRAERVDPGWTEQTALHLKRCAEEGSEPFLVEEAACFYRPQPANRRAWGHAVRLAVKNGWIRKVGYAPAASSNGSPKCLWAKASGGKL